ncbi:MAG: hypothetical protein Q9166_006694 [cf. Caloplaca sp. 2 TL-2023]
MAAIKAIEGRTVHQIQSGQVIVDLYSVVKELVENSLDAGSTWIAQKHYTSKLSTYDDLSSVKTFGFRGEALSSLCALSNFHVVTAQANEAPKGSRLDFETSGRLRATSVVASQRGTTVVVEALFANLPVRRRELEKNIKREYAKVIAVLQAYACISTSVKFSVTNVLAKGRKVVVFATKANTSTRENIANVFGAKTLSSLVALDLRFDLQHSRNTIKRLDAEDSQVQILGYVSKPVSGEGRQTPDRQMFFVNSRPCTLPQFAKIFNEVYKSYNVSQSPFVCANFVMDPTSYDVNVSPDKRTILLHEQTALLESLRSALLDLFERQDQTVPQTQGQQLKLPLFKPLNVQRRSWTADSLGNNDKRTEDSSNSSDQSDDDGISDCADEEPQQSTGIVGRFAGRDAQARTRTLAGGEDARSRPNCPTAKQKLVRKLQNSDRHLSEDLDHHNVSAELEATAKLQVGQPDPVADFSKQIAEQQKTSEPIGTGPSNVQGLEQSAEEEADIPAVESMSVRPSSGVIRNAFDRMRPRREPPDIATIMIGTKTTQTVLGSSPSRLDPTSLASSLKPRVGTAREEGTRGEVSSNVKAFAAPGALGSNIQSYCTPGTLGRNDPKAIPYVKRPSTAGEATPQEDSANEKYQADIVDGDQDDSVTGAENENSDEDYMDDREHKFRQDAKVADLVQQAEEKLAASSLDNMRRASKILKGRGLNDSTTQLLQSLHVSVNEIEVRLRCFETELRKPLGNSLATRQPNHIEEKNAEQKLSLIVSKEDFARMDVIGQFNLGFILAIRPSTSTTTDDEIFIVDQHASDEKYNFELLQASTTVQNQRLVRAKVLDLTAIEEEIIIENNAALLENGFVVEVDQSGASPVGQRCRLISLPMSREVTFDLSDLEELIALLGEFPPFTTFATPDNTSKSKSTTSHIPRPSKVRRIFAMRACRSSVMIGKSLQKRQMEKLVRHMGKIDKPWNCPHGRPTMRHVIGLGAWEGWREGDGLCRGGEEEEEGGGVIDWQGWLALRKEEEGDEGMSGQNQRIAASVTGQEDGGQQESGTDVGDERKGANNAPVHDDDRLGVDPEGKGRDTSESEVSNEEGIEDQLKDSRQSISQRFLFS